MNTSKDKKRETQFDIPVEGALGLLALGATGLRMWRKVRDEAMGKKEPQQAVKEGGAQ